MAGKDGWRRLQQDDTWSIKDEGGEWMEVPLVTLAPDHLVRLRDWLINEAARYAPDGIADPVGWMRQTPLYQRVARLIVAPEEEGVLVPEIFTSSDLDHIRKILGRELETMSEAEQAAARRVLWKIGQWRRTRETGTIMQLRHPRRKRLRDPA